MEMKFSDKFKKNKGEAAVNEAAQEGSKKKKHKPDPKKLVGTISKKHIKNGSYSMAMAAIFIVIVVVINMIVGAIPSKYSQLDVSSSKLYTIGDETKKVLKALDKDVTIYQIAQSGSEDDTISNLLKRYEDESKHIKVEVKDPVVNPKFASEYTTDDLAANSLIVVCGDRNKVISYNDMYSTSVDYNTWQQTTTGFDGEGQIDSAISYVTSENLPILYTLDGHGEKELDSTLKRDLAKLKAFITESSDEFRRPYAMKPMVYPRRTSFYATVNNGDFLKDDTGNRRYWVIPVEKIDFNIIDNLDINMLWGEVMHLKEDYNIKHYLEKDELELLNSSNEDFKISLNVELIVEREFDWESDKSNWKWKPTAEICSKLNINSTSSLKTSLFKYGAEYKKSNGRRGYITPPYKCPLFEAM